MRRFLACLSLLATGCTVHTTAIRRDFAQFNETIQYNQSQQMLLNLVRLKYRESPLFLKVGALSASYDFGAEAGASIGRTSSRTTLGASIGTSFSMRPTITYTPLEGETYVRQVLAEVAPSTFVLLQRSGWPIATLCHILVENIDTRINNEDEPSYQAFITLVQVLEQAQEAGQLDFVHEGEDIVLHVGGVTPDAATGAGLTGTAPRLPLSAFHLRSLLDIMFFRGKNTQ
ncbi:MAG: hypothetical protein ACE5IK_11675, partial [Acidobacteriota bacterium]